MRFGIPNPSAHRSMSLEFTLSTEQHARMEYIAKTGVGLSTSVMYKHRDPAPAGGELLF